MADAAEIGVSVVDTPHVAVVWGDQVALRAESVQAILTLHAGPGSPVITCPTVWRDEPYIHFERDENGNLRGVLQRREGDSMPLRGESDTGFFCFQTAPLRGLLKTMRALPEGRGASTGEFNLLPLIPFAAREGHTVITPQLLTLEETIGINSEADARHLEALWAARAAGGE
jgi:bifunctional N-acetylglucosamine-1-phosphate-uridyltransferase/glucosamine-1-phosphate-acetyltransferase GlmU-like protein